VTIGEDFLTELGRLGKRYSFFSYNQHQALKRIDSFEDLQGFLNETGFGDVEADDDTRAIAEAFVASHDAQHPESIWHYILQGLLEATPIGCLLLPVILPFVCVALAFDKHRRIQFTLAEIIGFTTLVAVFLAFETGFAPRFWPSFDLFHYRLCCSLVLAGLCGAVLFALFKRAVWFALSFTVAIECEAVAFVWAFLRA
jgi:hypothetical protein